MRRAGGRVRGDNVAIRAVHLWSSESLEKSDVGYVVRIGVQRGLEPIWIGQYVQAETEFPGNTLINLGPGEDVNYPLQDGDTLIAEYEKVGDVQAQLEVQAIIEFHRVGSVTPFVVDKGIGGMPGARDVQEPLFHDPDRASGRLTDQLNKSGLLTDFVAIPLTSRSEGGGGEGATTFLELLDTPGDYTGQADKFVRVAQTEDGLVFAAEAPGETFIGLPDTPLTYAGQDHKSLRVTGGAIVFIEPLMDWKDAWAAGSYRKGDVVRDGNWTMIANKDTSDRPAPQPSGPLQWLLPDEPAWTINNVTNTVLAALRVQTPPEIYAVERLRVWIQDVSPNAHYRLFTQDNNTGQISLGEEFDGDVLEAPGWLELVNPSVITTEDDFTLGVIQENSASETQFNHPWVRQGNSQNAAPDAQNWRVNNQNTNLRIHNTDDDTVDRSAELASVIPGSIIRIFDEGDINAFYEWEVGTVTDQGTYYEYAVTLLDTGSSGPPAVGNRCQIDFRIPIPVPTDYVSLANQWTPSPSITGILQIGNGTPTEDQTAYGVDIQVQQYSFSPDWDIVALNGGAGGGGAGVDVWTKLLDTPGDYSGFGKYETRVKEDETGLEFTFPYGALCEAKPTGLVDGGELNIGPGANDVEVIAGSGIVMDSYTDPDAKPSQILVSWPQINTAITEPPGAGVIVWLSIAPTGSPGPVPGTFLGALVQRNAPIAPQDVRDEIFLGVVVHNGTAWGEISSPVVVNNAAHTLSEYLTQVSGPSTIISGGAVREGGTFTLDQDAGVVWERNRNWHVNKKDPNRESFLARNPMQFRYTNRDFSDVSALGSTIDPTQWDDAGTVSPVGGGANEATIQRVYIDPRDNIWILWGQATYDNFVEAAVNINAEAVEVPLLLSASILLGYVVVEKGKTDWDPDEARFIAAGAGGGGGSPGVIPTTFLDLTDTPGAYTGEAGKVVAVKGAEDGLEFVEGGGGGGGGVKTAQFYQQQPSGQDGDSISANGWRTYVLNTTEWNDIPGASLASNQVTLPVGTYLFSGYGHYINSGRIKLRYRNVTDGVTVGFMTVGATGGSNSANTANFFARVVVTGGPKVFEFQRWHTNGVQGGQHGQGASDQPEKYNPLFIQQIAGAPSTPVAGPTGNEAYFREEYPQGNDGPSIPSGAWRTRVLNTTAYNTIPGCSISGNRITLSPGRYKIRALNVVYQGGRRAKSRIQNVTDNTTPAGGFGGSTFQNSTGNAWLETTCFVDVVGSSKEFELQLWQSTTQIGGANGNDGQGVNEVYAQVWVEEWVSE